LDELFGTVQSFSQDRDIGTTPEFVIGGNGVSHFFEIIENGDTSALDRFAHCETPIV
jgi:hypothetical protein